MRATLLHCSQAWSNAEKHRSTVLQGPNTDLSGVHGFTWKLAFPVSSSFRNRVWTAHYSSWVCLTGKSKATVDPRLMVGRDALVEQTSDSCVG
jgi:hypothetical protein